MSDESSNDADTLAGVPSTMFRLRASSTLVGAKTVPAPAQDTERRGGPTTSPTPPQSPPAHRYERLALLGEGGMGQVERARDRDLLREVAVKHLLPDLIGDPEMLGQFLWEARVTAYLDHPNIVPVHDLGQTDRGLFFTMKLVRGATLSTLLETAAKEPAAAAQAHMQRRLRMFLQLCHAVSFAHARGVLHRDLKPDNVMVGEYGEVLVTDWGIAIALPSAPDELRDVQPTGSVARSAGTPMYMSPEQARGDALDERSDTYTLGVILYEVIALRPAFSATSLPALLSKVLRGEAPELGSVAAGVPASLGAVVRKAMALDPAQRYATAAELAEDLETVLDGRTPKAEHASMARQFARYYVARDPAMSKLRVLDIDSLAGGSMLMGVGMGLGLAGWIGGGRWWWVLVAGGMGVVALPIVRWMRLRHASRDGEALR